METAPRTGSESWQFCKREEKEKKKKKNYKGREEWLKYLKHSKILLACKCKFKVRDSNEIASPPPHTHHFPTLSPLLCNALFCCCNAICFAGRLLKQYNPARSNFQSKHSFQQCYCYYYYYCNSISQPFPLPTPNALRL